MAITNAQQYQQLVKKPSGNERPGYRGPGEYQSGKSDKSSKSKGAVTSDAGFDNSVNRGNDNNIVDEVALTGFGTVDGVDYSAVGPDSKFQQNVNLKNELLNTPYKPVKTPFAPINFLANTIGKFGYEKNTQFFSDNSIGGKINPATGKPFGYGIDGYKDYMRQRSMGNVDAYGNVIYSDDDNDDQPIIPIIPQDPMTMDQATEELIEEEEPFQLARAFRADGGIMGGLADGQMDEMGRQMYGLGKLVKKATRAVKKIVKSPVGKAALLYAGAGGLGNLAAGKGFGSFFSGFTSPSTFLGRVPGIFTKSGLQNIGARIGFGGFENIGGERVFQKNILGKALTSPTGIVAATSLAAGLLTPEEELQAQELADSSTDFDLEKARNSILAAKREQYMMDVRARGFKADGGRIEYQEGSKEPVAKKTMPLLDMGGQEMDLRAEGGFVPIGRMEKADDVPARLSKNEFVFTAEAVRNAGDGDVDKGAEVMYNMMKNLEAGGEVSEESQGLEGARNMFQTSKRLEEVL